jgi:hypothetical protein
MERSQTHTSFSGEQKRCSLPSLAASFSCAAVRRSAPSTARRSGSHGDPHTGQRLGGKVCPGVVPRPSNSRGETSVIERVTSVCSIRIEIRFRCMGLLSHAPRRTVLNPHSTDAQFRIKLLKCCKQKDFRCEGFSETGLAASRSHRDLFMSCGWTAFDMLLLKRKLFGVMWKHRLSTYKRVSPLFIKSD